MESFLIIKSSQLLSREQYDNLRNSGEAFATSVGMKAMIIDGGLDAETHHYLSPLVSVIATQTEALNRMASSIAALASAVAEMVDDGSDGGDGNAMRTYMDGTPQ